MEQEEQSVSFGKVMKVAFKNWKRFLIIASLVTIGGSCAFIFGYNTLQGKYVSEFAYNTSDLKNAQYSDGSEFFYTQVISKVNLERAKASSADFSSIDVNKILDKGGISISQKITVLSDKNVSYLYTITVDKKYFGNKAQARSYIDAVASYPLEKDAGLAVSSNFDTNLVAFDSSDTYEKQLSFLEGQANSLANQYKKMLQSETLNSSVAGAIESNVVEINSIVGAREVTIKDGVTTESDSREIISQLRYTINEYGFVKDYDSAEAQTFENTKVSLAAEKTQNEAKIAALETEINNLTTNITVSTIDAQIATLVERNKDIDYEITSINKKIANKGSTDETFLANKASFEKTLSTFRAKLSVCTDSFVKVLNKLYIEGADVAYSSTEIVTEKGILSIPASIIISLLIGVVVGGGVNLIVDRKKLHE